MRRAAAVIGLSVLAAAGARAEDTVEHTRRFLGHGTLHIPVPAAWKVKTRVEPGRPSAMEFSPASGDEFQVLLIVFAPPVGNEEILQPAALRESLAQGGQRALAQAVEKTLEVKELKDTSNPCVYFSLTDRDPKDSYKYLVQAQARVGTLIAALTILHRSADSAPRDKAFDIIRGTRLVK